MVIKNAVRALGKIRACTAKDELTSLTFHENPEFILKNDKLGALPGGKLFQ